MKKRKKLSVFGLTRESYEKEKERKERRGEEIESESGGEIQIEPI